VDFNLKIGDKFTKDEIEAKFNTNFGRSIRGITLSKWEDETRYILLFSRADGPYTDKFEGDVLYYDGEGQNKDQELTDSNKALIESNETGRAIYGFRQYEPRGRWEYLGILEVLDYSYMKKNGFMTYEFKLRKRDLDIPPEISIEQEDIEFLTQEAPELTDDTDYDYYKRKKRDAAFSRIIKEIYDNSCSVCGKKRFTNSGYPEVEAAHIYPKSKDGSDDPRNGLSLCKLHHWAFDNGLFSIGNDFTIKINSRIAADDNYEEIWKYQDEKISLPLKNKYNPDILFLTEHRKLHEFNLL
jgi:putative restriction endonuclease